MMMYSAEFLSMLVDKNEEDIMNFVNNSSNGVYYDLLYGRGPECFHHLFDPTEHEKIEQAVKTLQFIETTLQKYGWEY